jgi:putative holliday junction resolvase
MAEFRRGRRLGIDWGDARIGVAVSDPAGMVPVPLDFVPAGDGELDRLIDLVVEYEPIEVVVGLPQSLSGSEGPAAVKIRGRAEQLVERLQTVAGRLPTDPPGVRLVDERLSTVSASRRLRASGKKAKAQRGLIDSEAAREILGHALDVERSGHRLPGQLLSAPDLTDGPDVTDGTDLTDGPDVADEEVEHSD